VPNSNQERDAEGAEIRRAHRDSKAAIARKRSGCGNLDMKQGVSHQDRNVDLLSPRSIFLHRREFKQTAFVHGIQDPCFATRE
jgi:hypothetical protein